MVDLSVHNPAMFSAPPGKGGGAKAAAPVAHPFSVVGLLTGDPNAVENTAPPVAPIRAGITGNPQQDAIATGRPIVTAHPTGTLGGLIKTVAPALGLRTDYSLNRKDPNGLFGAGEMMFPGFGGRITGELAADTAAKDIAAHQELLTASQKARSEGWGPEVKTPELKPGETSSETAGELGAKVRGAISGSTGRAKLAEMSKSGHEKAVALEEDPLLGKTAQQVRNIQDEGYSAERGRRIGQAKQAFEEAGGGVAGHEAQLVNLGGELPKLDWHGFKQFDSEAVNALIDHVHAMPNMQEFEKTSASNAILDAVNGKVPTQGDQALLERAFGREVTDQIVGSVPFWQAAKHIGLDLMNVPRAIMASADLSAPLRQGLVGMVTHPGIGLKAFPQMFKSFGSERVFQEGMDVLRNDPAYPLARKSGLPLTDIGDTEKPSSLTTREEQFQSNLAERLNLREIPGIGKKLGKYGTGPGDLIRASDRAYVMFLNKLRLDVFKSLALTAARDGRSLEDEKLMKDIGRFVGSATGRGPLGPFAKHAVTINATFFSPRLLASRLDILLAPATYLRADPFVRREALKSMFALVGTMSLVLELAKMGGAQVGLDPTNADFAKIRIGNTRIDLAGGFQQPVRLAFELAEGKITSSTTGKVEKLSSGIGKTSQGDVALRFLFSKTAPVPSFVAQASGVSQASYGPKQSFRSMAFQRLLPLLAQDANDLRTTPGAFGGSPSIGKAIGGYGLGVLGLGLQTYGNQPTGSGLAGPSSPPAHLDSMFGAPPSRGGSAPITHNSSMFSAPPGR